MCHQPEFGGRDVVYDPKARFHKLIGVVPNGIAFHCVAILFENLSQQRQRFFDDRARHEETPALAYGFDDRPFLGRIEWEDIAEVQNHGCL